MEDNDKGKLHKRSSEKEGFSRRTFLKASGLLGLGALAAGVSVSSCSSNDAINKTQITGGDATKNDGVASNTKNASVPSRSGGEFHRIVPGDELAQDLMLALCPERLACLVCKPSNHLVNTEKVESLPTLGKLSCYGGGESRDSLFDLLDNSTVHNADTFFSIDVLGMGRSLDVSKKFAECTGLSHLYYPLETAGWRGLLEWVSRTLGIQVPDDLKRCFELIDNVQDAANGLSDQDRFRILFCKGTRGTLAFGKQTSLAVCQTMAGCDYPKLSKEREGIFYLDTSDAYGVCPADLVFFADKNSYRSYLKTLRGGKKGDFSIWAKSEVDETNGVLPGVVMGCEWVNELSALLQCTFASTWLANYLYPATFQLDASSLLAAFNAWLHQSLSQDQKLNTEQKTLEERPNRTAPEERDVRDEYRKKEKKEADELWEKTLEANKVTPEKAEKIRESAEKLKEKMERERQKNREKLGWD